MTKFFLLLITICICEIATAQSKESIWYYNHYSWVNPNGTNPIDFAKMEVDSVAIIGGKDYFQLSISKSPGCYYAPSLKIHVVGEQVFVRDTIDQKDVLLYDFSLKAGEQYSIEYMVNGIQNKHTLNIDSVGFEIFDGVEKKVQYTSNIGKSKLSFEGKFIEELGNVETFFPVAQNCDPVDVANLRCYSDNANFINLAGFGCEEKVYESVDDLNKQSYQFVNPIINNVLQIRNYTGDISLIDTKGTKVLTGFLRNSDDHIDLSSLNSGVYYVLFENGNSQKMIKY